MDDKKTFADKTQKVEVFNIGPTPHAEHFLLTYLPEHGIIFEADHFDIAATGPLPSHSPNIAALVKSIQKHGLSVKQIVSAHNYRMVSYDELISAFNNHN